MSDLTAKTTIYLNPTVKRFIKHRAVADNTSISEIINDYFADMAEDLEDVKIIKERRKEPTVSFDKILSDLGMTYDDLRS